MLGLASAGAWRATMGTDDAEKVSFALLPGSGPRAQREALEKPISSCGARAQGKRASEQDGCWMTNARVGGLYGPSQSLCGALRCGVCRAAAPVRTAKPPQAASRRWSPRFRSDACWSGDTAQKRDLTYDSAVERGTRETLQPGRKGGGGYNDSAVSQLFG